MKTERFLYWVHVTFALVLLLLLLKFVIWICKDSKFFTFSEKENKKQTKITRYDKYNLVFGYIGISFISIITQGIILWTGHDFETGVIAFFMYHYLAMILLLFFICRPAFKYEYYYTKDQQCSIQSRVFIQTFFTCPFWPSFWLPIALHCYLAAMFNFLFYELKIVMNDQVKIPGELPSIDEKTDNVELEELPRFRKNRYVMLYPHGL
ncbi:hypothetical protein CRE_30758 [Caenorhabditis remanei]|uniref:Uncharacterized protein n=1 Tax=Caenorhabditis remanei TaxID=31234 RepID=E3LU42_CAERE|nr:hypothetical protein CRE_30758 [Caenorhabditis remanei]